MINRLNDYAFKRIFGDPANKDVLIDFLNSIILTDVTGPLVDLELDNRELDPEFIGDKASRLDILATTRKGTRINIEVQIVNLGGTERRSLFYWSRLYCSQLQSGSEYTVLAPVIAINVVNFEFLPDAGRFHQTFLLLERETGEPLTRDCEIHFLELPKFRRQTHTPKTKLDKWLTYLSNVQGKAMENIAMNTPAIKKALTIEEIFAQSEHERRLYELREKGLHDIATLRALVRKEGREEGREEGRQEGRQEGREEGLQEGVENTQRALVRRLLVKGHTFDQIADLVGLSLEEVKALAEPRVQEIPAAFTAPKRASPKLRRRSSRPKKAGP